MFKRLMMSILALSMVAIWVSEATARTTIYRRSVGVNATFKSQTNNYTGSKFTARIFGLPADEGGKCGDIWGTLYCGEGDNSEAGKLACDKADGYSAALVVALDKDAIAPNSPYLDDGVVGYFTFEDVNFNEKDINQRLELKAFREWAAEDDPVIISLPIGDVSEQAGFHVITDEAFNEDSELREYVGDWNNALGKFLPTVSEKEISKINLDPLWGVGLDPLVGKTICATVHHDEIKGDSLKGNYLGLAAFRVLQRSGSWADVEVLSAYDVCGRLLYNETEPAVTGQGQCHVAEDAIVWAPAPYYEGNTLTSDVNTFPEVTGTLNCYNNPTFAQDGFPYECTGTAEVVLNDTDGQKLCNDRYGFDENGDPNAWFADFIPKDRGGNDVYADYAFTFRIEPPTGVPDIPELNEELICGDIVVELPDGITLSEYGCTNIDPDDGGQIDLSFDRFTCFGCGQAPWTNEGTFPLP
ncbi:hypothetical protein DSCW_32850 [Desulfosarcina widdelii]|uniref:Uncharacterized protein n=1 Tax=Desulfosarcina widdelii TaxID=947919 RepID=A0A5K7Z4F3_9BACT|nr:hypothetical protein [Desulfosarcina widdelii]BBO75868.1 hypothetical protein DSCW_32850 [Desulfosarcina widdelii]